MLYFYYGKKCIKCRDSRILKEEMNSRKPGIWIGQRNLWARGKNNLNLFLAWDFFPNHLSGHESAYSEISSFMLCDFFRRRNYWIPELVSLKSRFAGYFFLSVWYERIFVHEKLVASQRAWQGLHYASCTLFLVNWKLAVDQLIVFLACSFTFKIRRRENYHRLISHCFMQYKCSWYTAFRKMYSFV